MKKTPCHKQGVFFYVNNMEKPLTIADGGGKISMIISIGMLL